MVIFTLYDENAPFFQLDIFVEEQFDFQQAYQKRKEIILDNTHFSVVPIDVLIEMKEKTARPQDKADAYYLRKIMEEWIDEK